jgi:hypothetical protein
MAHPFRKTIAVSIVHLAASTAATVVAVRGDLPADVFGHTSDKPVRKSLAGSGTALSAPPYMLTILALLTCLLASRGRGRTPAAVGVVIYGSLSLLGSLFERIVRRVFRPSSFELVPAACIVTVAGTALLIVVFGSTELGSYRRLSRDVTTDEKAGRLD